LQKVEIYFIAKGLAGCSGNTFFVCRHFDRLNVTNKKRLQRNTANAAGFCCVIDSPKTFSSWDEK